MSAEEVVARLAAWPQRAQGLRRRQHEAESASSAAAEALLRICPGGGAVLLLSCDLHRKLFRRRTAHIQALRSCCTPRVHRHIPARPRDAGACPLARIVVLACSLLRVQQLLKHRKGTARTALTHAT